MGVPGELEAGDMERFDLNVALAENAATPRCSRQHCNGPCTPQSTTRLSSSKGSRRDKPILMYLEVSLNGDDSQVGIRLQHLLCQGCPTVPSVTLLLLFLLLFCIISVILELFGSSVHFFCAKDNEFNFVTQTNDY